MMEGFSIMMYYSTQKICKKIFSSLVYEPVKYLKSFREKKGIRMKLKRKK